MPDTVSCASAVIEVKHMAAANALHVRSARRAWRWADIEAPSGVSRAEEKDAPGRISARFPDSRIDARSRSSRVSPVTFDVIALAAYSGGTVWASHPLRLAAREHVGCAGEYIRVASRVRFCVTLPVP